MNDFTEDGADGANDADVADGGAQASLPSVSQDPADPAFAADPWTFYERLHALGGAVRWTDYGMPCLAGFEAVNRVLRDRRYARLPPPATEAVPYPAHLAAFARVERHSLLALEGRAHTRLRKLVGADFTGRHVRRLAPGIAALAHERIDALDPGDDLVAGFATPLPVTLIARLIGVPDDETPELLAWSHAMVRVYTMVQSAEEERAAEAAAAAFEARLLDLIAERRRQLAAGHPVDDLVGALVARRGPEAPSDAEIVSVAVLLLNAGHEATVHQIGNAARTLLELPSAARSDALAGLAREGAAREAVATELMRHRAPLHLFVRHAQERTSPVPGLSLEPGDRVALLLGAANRDPARFADPARFDPTRQDAATLSLGAGTHYCLGAHLARLEVALALTALFERLPTLRLDAEPRVANTYHFHGLQELRVRW